MLPKRLLEEVLQKALSTGADFAEVYVERTKENSIFMIDSKVDSIKDRLISGVGIRILKGTRCITGSTSSMEREALLACAGRVADALDGVPERMSVHLTERIFGDIHPIKMVPDSASMQFKTDLLKEGYFAAKNYHQDISQVTGTLLDVDHNILIANSDGLLARDRQIRTRMMIEAVASKNGENQTGGCRPGRRMGLEMFEQISPKDIGTEAARQAITILNADYLKAGNMPVAIENGFGGVIFHEACGHALEATSVAKDCSVFCGKLGQKYERRDYGSKLRRAWGFRYYEDGARE